jgi:hypothetical protein
MKGHGGETEPGSMKVGSLRENFSPAQESGRVG